MPKAYWVAHVKPNDDDAFKGDAYKAYIDGAGPCFQEYNANFLARGGNFIIAEGEDLGSRHVVIEFASLDDAKACYNSKAYQAAREHRTAVSEATIMLIEGAKS